MLGRTIAIVGAGQAGLQLAIALVKKGLPVTIYTNRDTKQLLAGNIMSSQGMFHSALREERRLGLNFWDSHCPHNKSVTLTVTTPGAPNKVIHWQGRTSHPYQAVDQRLKFSSWMEEFKRLGGKLHIQDVGLPELDKIAKWHDLTLVAGGKGEISRSFPRDTIHSHFDKPQRALACFYATGVASAQGLPGVRANIIPGVGEFFIMPGLSASDRHPHGKPCEMLLFEGIPGSPFDCWEEKGIAVLSRAKALLRKYVPWEAERCQYMELTDSKAMLSGRYTPVVRHPVFTLPCGKSVLGIGDTVVLNDPIAGQGANTAAKAAALYADEIIKQAQAGKKYDEAWMRTVYQTHWHRDARWATKWSHTLLMPPEPHVLELLSAAERLPTLTNFLADGFDNPKALFPALSNPKAARRLILDMESKESRTTKALTTVVAETLTL